MCYAPLSLATRGDEAVCERKWNRPSLAVVSTYLHVVCRAWCLEKRERERERESYRKRKKVCVWRTEESRWLIVSAKALHTSLLVFFPLPTTSKSGIFCPCADGADCPGCREGGRIGEGAPASAHWQDHRPDVNVQHPGRPAEGAVFCGPRPAEIQGGRRGFAGDEDSAS